MLSRAMSSFMILFIWLGFSSLSKVVLSAADDDTFLLNPTDASDPNPLWSTDDDGLTLLSDTANGCTSLDSGFLGKLRARGQCGDIPSSPINDGNLFSFDGPLNVEGSSDIALLDQDQLSNSDSLFGSDTLSSLDPTSDISISVGAACQSSNPQFLRRFRPRGAACKNPELVKKSPTWDPNLDLGIYTQGHPDYEWLRRLPFAPGRNNDEACPSWVVGYRYAVCGPSNEAQDVIGWGTTLRSCSLCR